MSKGKRDELPVKGFRDQTEWRQWLDAHHAASPGIWLELRKKAPGARSLTYAEALEVALCYGWIDGQKKAGTDETFLQRFTPRRKRSLWSKVNREKALALSQAGEMRSAGIAAIEEAKRNGQWERAYEGSKTAAIPDDLQQALHLNPRARQFFETLNATNRYAMIWRIQTVKKAETRARKIAQFVEMLERGEKIHP